jgi:hypothetical protein
MGRARGEKKCIQEKSEGKPRHGWKNNVKI